jgi:hypothetical protein
MNSYPTTAASLPGHASDSNASPSVEMPERGINILCIAELEHPDRTVSMTTSAREDDEPRPRPPGGGYAAALADYGDDDLIAAVAMVDGSGDRDTVRIDASNPAAPEERHPTIPSFILRTSEEKEAFLSAATEEVLRRIGRADRLAA